MEHTAISPEEAAICRYCLCARVDSNHHPAYTGQGPQPCTPAPYTSVSVQIVRFVRVCGRIGRIGQTDICQRFVTPLRPRSDERAPRRTHRTPRGRSRAVRAGSSLQAQAFRASSTRRATGNAALHEVRTIGRSVGPCRRKRRVREEPRQADCRPFPHARTLTLWVVLRVPATPSCLHRGRPQRPDALRRRAPLRRETHRIPQP